MKAILDTSFKIFWPVILFLPEISEDIKLSIFNKA